MKSILPKSLKKRFPLLVKHCNSSNLWIIFPWITNIKLVFIIWLLAVYIVIGSAICDLTGILWKKNGSNETETSYCTTTLPSTITLQSTCHFINTLLLIDFSAAQQKWFLTQTLWERVWTFLNKLRIKLPHNPTSSLWNTYTQDTKTFIQKNMCIPWFAAALSTIIKIWN